LWTAIDTCKNIENAAKENLMSLTLAVALYLDLANKMHCAAELLYITNYQFRIVICKYSGSV